MCHEQPVVNRFLTLSSLRCFVLWYINMSFDTYIRYLLQVEDMKKLEESLKLTYRRLGVSCISDYAELPDRIPLKLLGTPGKPWWLLCKTFISHLCLMSFPVYCLLLISAFCCIFYVRLYVNVGDIQYLVFCTAPMRKILHSWQEYEECLQLGKTKSILIKNNKECTCWKSVV